MGGCATPTDVYQLTYSVDSSIEYSPCTFTAIPDDSQKAMHGLSRPSCQYIEQKNLNSGGDPSSSNRNNSFSEKKLEQ